MAQSANADKVEAKVGHRFKSAPERVYDAWLDPEKARTWMRAALISGGLAGDIKRTEIDPRVGGRFLFSDMRDGKEARHWGVYLELDRPRKIVFTWVTDESEEDDPSKVNIAIEPDGEGALVTLTHEMPSKWASYVPRVETGWGRMLAAIDALPA